MAEGFHIVVMEEGRTANSVRLSVDDNNGWAIHRFDLIDGAWTLGETDASGPHGGPTRIDGFSGVIAKIYDGTTLRGTWSVSNKTTLGFHYYALSYGSTPVNRAQFVPGTHDADGYRYTTHFARWIAYRTSAPSCYEFYWTRYPPDSDWQVSTYSCFTGGTFQNYPPQGFELKYELDREPLPPLVFSLYDYEANDSEYRLIALSPLRSESQIQSVVWERSANQTTWTQVPPINCGLYPSQIAGGFRSTWPNGDGYIRATLTLTTGQVGTANLGGGGAGEFLYLDFDDIYQPC